MDSTDLELLMSKIIYRSVNEIAKVIEDLGLKNKRILLVSDQKIWKKYQRFFTEEFRQIFSKHLILKEARAEEHFLKQILNAAKNQQLIIALGSGVVNDLCKLTSVKAKIPYLIIPSAPSMNGYLSQNASIKISGHAKTIPATLPLAVICDLKILATAPTAMIKAGIGDALCFYSCWFDWYLSHRVFNTTFNLQPFEILVKKMDFLLRNFTKFSLKDPKFIEKLIEILLISGIGMTIAGGSYPASQSEHLIAHSLTMKYPKKMAKILHGRQIAVTTFTSVRLQKSLLEQDSLQVKKYHFPEEKITKFFNKKVAQHCKNEFEQKILSPTKINEINNFLQKNWLKLRRDLNKIFLTEERLRELFQHFRISASPRNLKVSKRQYQECVDNARFIRNRFTCLDFF